MAHLKYPIGVQNFREIITGNWIYVDKTNYIRDLTESGKYYFLGRPRRFGKSLLLSTMHAFFEGDRGLFQGLAIGNWKEWKWEKHPVIHIDLNATDYTRDNSLEERIGIQLRDMELEFGIDPMPDAGIDNRLYNLIVQASVKTGQKAVVLIDEYDKPILDTMHDKSLEDMHRDKLRGFYSVLKSADQYIRMGFLTGITKFGQLNIFSGLNNIQDISLRNEFAGICGISEQELVHYFKAGIEECANKWKVSADTALQWLKDNYDGYHFAEESPDIYNPWSLLNALAAKNIRHYWNASGGTASFIYKIIRSHTVEIQDLNGCKATDDELYGTSVGISSPIALLYQAGYLTIKGSESKWGETLYTLGYPNREVESGFIGGLLDLYSSSAAQRTRMSVYEFVNDLNGGNLERFLNGLKSFMAGINFEIIENRERHFQTVMYCIAALIGLHVNVEEKTSDGSIDMVIRTDRYIYILEFKVDKSPGEALKQIREKGYADKFGSDSRKCVCAGVSFSTHTRKIDDFIIQPL